MDCLLVLLLPVLLLLLPLLLLLLLLLLPGHDGPPTRATDTGHRHGPPTGHRRPPTATDGPPRDTEGHRRATDGHRKTKNNHYQNQFPVLEIDLKPGFPKVHTYLPLRSSPRGRRSYRN